MVIAGLLTRVRRCKAWPSEPLAVRQKITTQTVANLVRVNAIVFLFRSGDGPQHQGMVTNVLLPIEPGALGGQNCSHSVVTNRGHHSLGGIGTHTLSSRLEVARRWLLPS